jgi:hypothetical protein
MIGLSPAVPAGDPVAAGFPAMILTVSGENHRGRGRGLWGEVVDGEITDCCFPDGKFLNFYQAFTEGFIPLQLVRIFRKPAKEIRTTTGK